MKSCMSKHFLKINKWNNLWFTYGIFFVYKILFLGAAIFIPEIFFLNSVAVRYTKNRVENWEPPARSVKINMSGLN